MRLICRLGLAALGAAALAACAGDTTDETAAPASAPPSTPYRPVATIVDLMRSTITLSAEVYWESVSVVVDADGIHENMPETELEWIEVWAAGITLAESGNLLMMPPRAVDTGEWQQFSNDLIDAGLKAAQAATDRDFEAVLAVGEEVYNVCVDCHRVYVPTLPDL